jgi:hypothetical protein
MRLTATITAVILAAARAASAARRLSPSLADAVIGGEGAVEAVFGKRARR